MNRRRVAISEFSLVPLFAGLDRPALQTLATHANEMHLVTGQVLFRKGDDCRHFFLLKSGRVRLYLLNEAGQEHTIEMFERERTFAEAVMFMGGSYPVFAEAMEPSRVLAFDAASFRQLLMTHPTLSLAMLASLSRQLHTLVSDIDRLSLQQGERRLARYLLGLPTKSGSHGRVVALPVSKQAIATLLDIRPETLSRLLARFSQHGMIDVAGNEVTLLDRRQLMLVE